MDAADWPTCSPELKAVGVRASGTTTVAHHCPAKLCRKEIHQFRQFNAIIITSH